MAVKFEIVNPTTGTVQINTNDPVLSFIGKTSGTAYAATSITPGIGLAEYSYSGVAYPAAAIRCETMSIAPVTCAPRQSSAYLVMTHVDYAAHNFEAYFFDFPRNVATGKAGLWIRHPVTGRLVFDSNQKPAVIHDIVTLSASNSYSALRQYDASRKYAVLAYGVYFVTRPNGSISFTGAHVSVQKTSGTVNALILDVTNY